MKSELILLIKSKKIVRKKVENRLIISILVFTQEYIINIGIFNITQKIQAQRLVIKLFLYLKNFFEVYYRTI